MPAKASVPVVERDQQGPRKKERLPEVRTTYVAAANEEQD